MVYFYIFKMKGITYQSINQRCVLHKLISEEMLMMKKLLNTMKELSSVTKEEKRYYISWYERGYTETCHNDRWEVPGKTHIIEVSKSEYERSSSKHEIRTVQVPMTFEEFSAVSEKNYKQSLRDLEGKPNQTNVKTAIFEVNQYRIIIKAKLLTFKSVSNNFDPILVDILKHELASVEKILSMLEVKQEEILEKAKQQKVLNAQKKKEREERKAIREAKKAEEARLKKIKEMEKELAKLKQKA